jgi:hypothetical protein
LFGNLRDPLTFALFGFYLEPRKGGLLHFALPSRDVEANNVLSDFIEMGELFLLIDWHDNLILVF